MPYIGNNHIAGDHTNNFKVLDDISSYTATFNGSASSVIDTTNNTIRVVEHRFIQGQRVTYTNGGGGNIGGLTTGTAYFIIHDSSSTFKLATSAANAATSTAINLSSVGSGNSHTLNAAFDGINTKFKLTHGSGTGARLNNATQINVAINNVLQRPNLDPNNFTDGFALEDNHKIVFQTAPTSEDIFWGSIIANTLTTFDISDHNIDTFTGDGTTTEFNLSHVPANNESLMVSINGVLQHPSNASTARSYTLIANVLQFTSAPANGDEIQVRHIGFAGSSTSDVTGFYGRTGNVVLGSTDHITTGDITSRNINSSGIITATTFDGAFSSSVGGSNANFTGIVTAGVFKGGDFDGRNLNISGIATFAGDVSIGGTLTYEDVTNIDAVGIVTAREGIHIPDNKRLDFGGTAGSGDFEIRHTNGHSHIQNNTGHFFITQGTAASSHPLIIHGGNELQLKHYYSNGGALFALKSVRGYQTEIYWQGQKKIETTSKGILVGTGVTIETSGQANFAGITTISGTDLVVKPSAFPGVSSRIKLGYSEQLKFTVSSANQVVMQSTGAYLQIASNTLNISRADLNLHMATFKAGREIELTYNYVNRLVTSGVGVTVYNQLDTTNLSIAGVSTFTGNIDANGDLDVDGHTNLDNVSIAGVTTASDNIRIIDSKKLLFGDTNGDMKMYHLGGANSYIVNTANNLYIQSNNAVEIGSVDTNGSSVETSAKFIRNGAAELYHNDQKRLETSSVGVSIPQDLDVDGHTNLDNVSIVGITTITNVNALRLNHASGCYQTFLYNGTARGYAGTGNHLYTGGNSGDFGFAGGSSANIVFATSNSERLRITSGGNTLIAHSTAAITDAYAGNALEVGGSTYAKIALTSGTNTLRADWLWDDANVYFRTSTASNLFLGTNNTPRIKIANNSAATTIGGNLTFNAMLTVQGDLSGAIFQLKAAENTTRMMVSGLDTTDCEVNLYDKNGGQRGILVGGETEFALKAPNSNAPMKFYTHNGSSLAERVQITSSGSVRIGGSTNSSFSAHAAASNLVVGTTSGSNGMTILTGSGTGNIFFNDGSGNDGVVQYVHSSSPNYMRIASSGHIRFDAAAISISDDNIAPTAGDMASGASFGIPRLHMRGDGGQSGAYELMARFQSGQDANDSGATIVLNHSNDRGLALQGGRGQSNRSFGAIKAIDNVGRLSNCIDFLGGNGQGVNYLRFFTGESTTTTERFKIDSSGKFYKEGDQFYPLVNYSEYATYGQVTITSSSYTDLRTLLSGYTPKKAGNLIVIHHQSQCWQGGDANANGDAMWRIQRQEGGGSWTTVIENNRIMGNMDGRNYTGGSGLSRHHRTVHLMGSFECAGTSINFKSQGLVDFTSPGLQWYHQSMNIFQIWEYAKG